MVSLLILLLLLLGSLLMNSWAMAITARSLGSRRGRLPVGLLAMLLTTAFDLACLAVTLLLRQARPSPALLFCLLLLLLLNLFGVFFILRRTFALSTAPTFAVYGAHIAASVIAAAVAFLLVRPYLTEAFILPTASMAPTLSPGDRFLVDKLLSPRRWDLVAYRHHASGSAPASIWCKRLVGLPGDHLRFQDGNLYINDHPAPGLPSLLAGRLHAYIRGALPVYADGNTITLGPDDYFLVGDNVEISADSRLEGPSPRSAFVGVVDFVYWPAGKVRVVR